MRRFLGLVGVRALHEPAARLNVELAAEWNVRLSARLGVETGEVLVGDPARGAASVSGAAVQLPLKEFDLLELLLRNAGRVLTRGQLIDRVWGSDYVGDTKTLDVHVKRLRAKIEPDPSNPRHLVTVRGLGYKFET